MRNIALWEAREYYSDLMNYYRCNKRNMSYTRKVGVEARIYQMRLIIINMIKGVK